MTSWPATVAIQGELGSNSHVAAAVLYPEAEMIACVRAEEVVRRVAGGVVDVAVLPVENTLHGSVAEHYDLLLDESVRIVAESLLRIRHNIIAAPGIRLAEVRRLLSHPVALSQCRRWLAEHPEMSAEPFYDTAGSVKFVLAEGLRDVAGVAPLLAAQIFGGEVLVEGIEDHSQNYTRFHTLVGAGRVNAAGDETIDKLSVAFTLEHRPGTLVEALRRLAASGADLTRIESRPVHGRPWEYTFLVDLRCDRAAGADAALDALRPVCGRLQELGRYRAAVRALNDVPREGSCSGGDRR